MATVIDELEIKVNSNGLDALLKALDRLDDKLSGTSKSSEEFARAAGKVSRATEKVGKSAEKATPKISQFMSSIMRIAKYRLIRTALREMIAAFKEGLQNAYSFSKATGGDLAEAMDSLSAKTQVMKNQMGAAFGALITAIRPIVEQIIALIVRLAQALTMLLRALGGNSTYLRAVESSGTLAENLQNGAGAAKELRRQLMGFDEINRLDEPSNGGGGGGLLDEDENPWDFEENPLPEWLQRLSDLVAELKLTVKDILFNWDDLNPEQVAMKIITGISGLLGAVSGFIFGGVPGAIVGTILGVGIGALISTLTFDNDGKISKGELASMLNTALYAFCGGFIGFTVGGPGGALLGALVGIGIKAAIETIAVLDPEKKGQIDAFLGALTKAMGAFLGGAIGFSVGGPAGALIGGLIGIGITLVIEDIGFEKTGKNGKTYTSNVEYFFEEVLGLPSQEEMTAWMNQQYAAFGEDLYGIFVQPILEIVDDIKGALGISSPSTVMKDIGDNMVQGLWDGIESKWNGFVSWFEEKWDALKTWWTGLSLPQFSFRLPHLTITYEPASWSVFQFLGIDSIPHFSVAWYANGGFPEDGLFMANHGEMVGQFSNGRTAVANNEQIVAGIERGVYNAMTAALASQQDDNRPWYIYLDGKQISGAVTKGQRNMSRATGVAYG